MKNFKKGFTLIELLVVISIIGLLTSVVLASLNSARVKAANASVKSNLNAIRSQSAVYFDQHGNYLDSLAQTSFFNQELVVRPVELVAFDAAVAASGETDQFGSVGYWGVDVDSWTAMVKLRGDDPYWCVDSTGFSNVVSYPDVDPEGFSAALEELVAGVPISCATLDAM